MGKDVLTERNEKLINHLIKAKAMKTKIIIEAFKKVPRHNFVLKTHLDQAYEDIALPIVGSSTISQPYTVATMLEHLQPKKNERVLEIGTGSGWQACLLAYCIGSKGKVVTIEIDWDVARFAKENMKSTKIKNIKNVEGDGSMGYEREAPYDKIIYTAATPQIPDIVIKQLKVGGKIIAPVGDLFEQVLTVVDKVSEKEIKKQKFDSFTFVPLRGKLGI
ncbi:MAG TPA: protein-L-isoaspartate(D-aspartate) O-methyltransferase [archaeon]|nr:protein-L-isoaspartate(D-aspartate) O-methyltransferase [archaeon]